jgi:hypothetical protein
VWGVRQEHGWDVEDSSRGDTNGKIGWGGGEREREREREREDLVSLEGPWGKGGPLRGGVWVSGGHLLSSCFLCFTSWFCSARPFRHDGPPRHRPKAQTPKL